jgi:propanol-preferring alcohol dehydrogenase
MTGPTQKAVIFYEHNGPLEYKDVPIPVPKDTDILVQIKYSGVCHSDLHAWKGDWPDETQLPLIGGHEGAGVVVAKGSKVSNFEIGDFAGVKWTNKTCLTCEYCIGGEETCCVEQDISGYSMDGTFQQYCVADAIQAAKISKNTNLAEVAPILCAGLTAYKALKKANLKPGQWVAVIGAGGGLGSFAVQYANAMGLRVIGIDSGSKKEMVLNELKAEKFVDFTSTKDIVSDILDLTNGGAHGVLNFSVSEVAMNLGIKYVRALGTVVLVGMPAGAVAQSNVYDHIGKQFNLTASSVGGRQDTVEALDFFERGLIKSKIEVFPLSDLSKVYQLMEENKILGRIVVDTSK